MSIRIGTSGYSFKDWKGPFYPENISAGAMLKYYSAYFDVAEINVTYYRIPPPAAFERMAAAVPRDFGFTVKLHGSMTHTRTPVRTEFEALKAATAPLAASGKLLGLLAQFPWSFSNTSENRLYLQWLFGQLSGFKLFVEFRHASWIEDDTFELLEKNSICFCMVDEPRLEGLVPPIVKTTGDTTYIRFHGRNAVDWWQPRPGSDRYLYDYSSAELEEWIPVIQAASEASASTLVFFNNCHFGHAPRNALRLKEMLGIPPARGITPDNELVLES